MNRFATLVPRRASVLIATVLILVILQLVVATVVLSGGRDADLTKSRWGQARSFYNAESAVAMGLREVAKQTDYDADGTIGSVSNDGNDANNPALNGGTLKAVYAAGTPNTITATGAAISTARSAVVNILATPPSGGIYRPGLYLESWVIGAPTLVSAFDWAQPPTTVGWVHNVYWPNQTSGAMMFVGQTTSAARLTGKINADADGAYEFGVDVDDDVQLLIDGASVLSAGSIGTCRRITGAVTLTAGLHDFELRFTDGGDSSCLMAWWKTPSSGAFTVIPPTAFQWSPAARLPGLVTTGTISFSGNGSAVTAAGTAGWDAGQGAYSSGLQIANEGDVASNLIGANTITGYNGSTVRGDASVGVGGNPATDIYFNSSASVTGTRAALSRSIANVIHRLPITAPPSSGSMNLWGNNTLTISTDCRYDSISMSGTSTLTVSGDRTVYVSGSVNVTNSSQVVVLPGSVLRLYVDGALNVNTSAVFNTSALPGRCYIYMTGSGQNLGVTNSAQLHAHVRAPLCPAGLSSDAVFSGTLYAATFQASNQAQLRLDCGPLDPGSGGSGGSPPPTNNLVITGYTEP